MSSRECHFAVDSGPCERGGAHTFFQELGFLPVKTQRVYEKLITEK